MPQQDVSLYKGDTFVLNGVYKDASGSPVNLSNAGITISCTVMTPNGLEEMATTVTPDANQVANTGKFKVTADTTNWPVFGCYSVKLSYSTSETTFSQRFDLVILQ